MEATQRLITGSRWLPVFFLSTALVAGVGGCSSIVRQIEAPQVELVGLQVMAAQINRQTFRLSLDVSNPNPVPVPINAIRYDINLGGGPLGAGKTEESFTLPANGTERVRMEVSTDLIGTLNRLSSLLKGSASTVDYEISGDFTVPLMDPIPFSSQGQVPLAIQ